MGKSLDGTPNKARLGANAILGVSMAACRAGAAADGVPLYQFLNKLAGSPEMVMPVPCFNCINGGVHAGNYLPFQEFFLIPIGATNFKEAMRMGSETYHILKGIIKEKHGPPQDGRALPLRAAVQVQPAAPHRGGA